MMLDRGKTEVSVVILSYNTKAITRLCLQKVKAARDYAHRELGTAVEVIVVEQGSSDGSAEMIRRKFPWVQLIALKRNVGFTRGNNLGMRRARGRYFLVINNDTFIGKDTLARLVRFMEKRPDCDVLGVGLRYPDGRFQPSGGYLPNPWNTILRFLEIDRLPLLRPIIRPIPVMQPSFYRSEREMGWVSGALLFMKYEVFERTGGFDEQIFWYGDDQEWCRRVHEAGFRILFTPTITVTHVHAATSKGDVFGPYQRQLEGYLYYHRKYYPKWVPVIRLIIRASLLGRAALFFFLNRKKARAYQIMVHRI